MIQEVLPPDTARAFAAMRELRPQLTDVDAFVGRVDQVQRPEGYRLVAAFDDTGDPTGDAVAVGGFRLIENLAWGRVLYVDDLSTRTVGRRQGWAGRLLGWMHAEAARLECDQVHLDSGVGAARHDAHRLYLASGYAITAHHFARSAL